MRCIRHFWGLLVCALLVAFTVLAALAPSFAQIVGISITVAPPVLPVYEQPEIPGPGYLWTPGYWAYGPDGYFWVPGTWVQPPTVGFLWTPGYWGWRDGIYVWNAGYWGRHIGFYGGVNYGFGYGGVGYEGGYWNNGVFAYNRTVNNFGGVTIVNVYNKTVINNTTVTRTSFNGGSGGTAAQPTPQEQAAAHEQHLAATPLQAQHEHTASTNKALLASVNNGRPSIAATSKPGEFTGKGVVAAREVKPGTMPLKNTTGKEPPGKGAGTLNGGTSTKLNTEATPTKPGATLTTTPTGNGAIDNKGTVGKDRALINNGTPTKQLGGAGNSPPPRAPLPVAAAPHPAVPHPGVQPQKDIKKKPPA
jgi:YXWGXW repeat-containing protein